MALMQKTPPFNGRVLLCNTAASGRGISVIGKFQQMFTAAARMGILVV
jgi:hypothetical protein